MGSKKVHWDLKKCIEISKDTLRSQKMLSDLKQCFGISKNQCNLKEMVDIVEIVQTVVMFYIVDIDIVEMVDTFNIDYINEQ